MALDLAEHYQCEILNFDSIQVYEDLNIGAAKPTPEQLNRVRHHLLGAIPLSREYTAGDFRRDALDILASTSADKIVLVGGTGFYLSALLNGMHEVGKVSEETKARVADEMDQHGSREMYYRLKDKDPEYADKIHFNDRYRISRGWEIIYETGKLPSKLREQFKAEPFPYPVTKLGLEIPRQDLLENIKLRTQQMIESGLEEEVSGLLERHPNRPRALDSVGYLETRQYLSGELDEKQWNQSIVKSTMALAKRQKTWFQRDSEIFWLEAGQDCLAKAINQIDSREG